MKKFFFLSVALVTGFVAFSQIKVVSNEKLGEGFYPRFDYFGEVVTYIDDEYADYALNITNEDLYVSNEDLLLVLYRNGRRTVLTPDGTNVNYIWSSVSPNGKMILYNTSRGTSVCDLQGKHLYYLGHLNAPQWYGNDYVVGMHDLSDGHVYIASSIAIHELATGKEQTLTNASELGMYPSVCAQKGKIVYNTLNGEIRLLQLNLTDEPISAQHPVLKKAVAVRRVQQSTKAKTFSDIKIYINPGHGGHGSNDRPMTIYPFAAGDVKGFWESNSNLDKGLALDSMLTELGIKTMMSRRTNNDGGGGDSDVLAKWLDQGKISQAQYKDMLANGDDRALSAIVAEANTYGADFMLSIHSNAGGPANYVLELYAGKDADDTHTYRTATPVSEPSRNISTIIGNNLQSNILSPWTRSTPWVVGDKTFGLNQMGWGDGYGVMRGLKVPGVISEGSMHDYIPQTYRLMNMDYKRMEAWFFTKSFLTYFLDYKMPKGVIGGQVRDAYNKQLFPALTHIRNSNDELEPINGAKITLLQNNVEIKTYTTDELYNGIFFFWNLEPGKYVVRCEKEHYYVQETEVEVAANEISQMNMMLNMKRETRPEVLSYSPQVAIDDSVEVFTPIVMNFNWDMLESATKDAFSISPNVEGTITFSNSQKTMTFVPTTGYEPGVEYTVTLAKSACHPDSTVANTMENDFTFRFRTKNRAGMAVKQVYPANGATNVSLTPAIFVVFDAPVGAGTVASNFTVTDGADYTYTPKRNTIKNAVAEPFGSFRFDITSDLQPNTQYKVIISKELKDNSNVPMVADYEFSFTTGEGNAKISKGESIINCDEVAFELDADKSKAIADKTIMTSKNKRTEGLACNDIQYSFNDTDADPCIFLKPLDLSQIFTSLDTFVMDICGDLSENDLYIEFSTEGDIHLIPVTKMDYAGYQTMEISLETLPEAVQFQFTGIKIVKSESILSMGGEVFIDDIRRVKGEEKTDVENLRLNSTIGQEYFDLLGRKIAKPNEGVVIVRDNNTTSKQIIY